MKKLLIFCVVVGFVFSLGNTAMAAKWNVPDDFSTIQDAIDDAGVFDGDTIFVGAGEHAGALVTKAVEIKGQEGAIINDGPVHPFYPDIKYGFRLNTGSDGATLSHLRFEFDGFALAIMNGAAVDDVTVSHCTFIKSLQAISNWCGSGWQISHNVITDLRTRSGGGIGILIADWTGGTVQDNIVSHNKITGTLHVMENDGGGYCGTGIVIYADFRWSRTGAEEISNNRVVKNKISLVSDTPGVVDVVAFELTDTRNNTGADPYPVVFDNAIGFNDFRGTTDQLAFTPEDLKNQNDISRNFGDNRGHGEHPSVFGPGGN